MSTREKLTLSGADFSDDGVYRWRLWRHWGPGRSLNVIMLNPSTADASVNDPTIRRCIGFAAAAGFGELVVTNLFALRSTSPKALVCHDDPVGGENDGWIGGEAGMADQVVAAWGALGNLQGRAESIRWLMRGQPVLCWGTTKDGHPRHPLYLPRTAHLVPFWS